MGEFRRTQAWRRLRRAVFARDCYRCRRCGRPGRLEAHHVKRVQDGGADVLDNLLTLCRGCHIAEHRGPPDPEREAWRLYIK